MRHFSDFAILLEIDSSGKFIKAAIASDSSSIR